MNGRRRRHGGADQVRAATSALTAFKVTVAGAGATLARFESIGIHGQAHRATGFAPFKASCFEDLVKALALGLFFDQARARHHHGVDAGADLLAAGRALARDWPLGPSAFLTHYGVASELDYKRQAMAEGRVMCHAQIGWRDPGQSIAAYHRIWEASAAQGHRVDRYGLCLDWSMALPRSIRDKGMRGTGMILRGVEDFVALANAAPVAAHFGDFVLGFPAALENTQAALAAGATAIGNLGQYFTFRVPGHDDDIEATAATVTAT